MTSYRRNFIAGGSFFFTVNLAERRLPLLTEHIDELRAAFRETRRHHPFTIDAMVVLPDHLHTVWTIPEGDADFATRWRLIKSVFSRRLPAELAYPAKVTLLQDWIEVDGRHETIRAGMRVSAEIKTGNRRVIEYLLSPVMQAVKEAGREMSSLTNFPRRWPWLTVCGHALKELCKLIESLKRRKLSFENLASGRYLVSPVPTTSSWKVFSATAVALISFFWCVATSSTAIAQEERSLDKFVWWKDSSTGTEIAASQNRLSFNFLDIGNFSPFSLNLVKEHLAQLSNAAGVSIERSLNSSIKIIHDSNVFERLQNDRRSFIAVGIPDDVIEKLVNQITDDSPKCLTVSLDDDQHNIVLTVILLSEYSNSCLVGGLLASFGVRSSSIDNQTLIDVCVLYEGRRRGLRDRQSLSQEFPSLHDACLTKVGEEK